MDRVRFGRALGVGARQAAKSLLSAAEAAAAPNPDASPGGNAPRRTAAPTTPSGPTAPWAEPSQRTRVGPQPAAVKAQARNLGRSVWSPFARFSSVLWLEVTGTFFAIFALVAAEGVWKLHAALRLPPSAPEARRAYFYVAIFALFAYFAVSSFVRARQRSRK